jgi:hypothetical protein
VNLANAQVAGHELTEAFESLAKSREKLNAIADSDPNHQVARSFLRNADFVGASALNARAWRWATSPDETVRNGKQAVADAARACKLTEWRNPAYLDTLAAAK